MVCIGSQDYFPCEKKAKAEDGERSIKSLDSGRKREFLPVEIYFGPGASISFSLEERSAQPINHIIH